MNSVPNRRRRRLIIGLFLFVALLAPIVALSAAVADAYPGYVCGRWWYGVIVVGLIVGNWQK